MNKKILPAVTFGVAILLFGTIAYAADRRKSVRSKGQAAANMKEEETLRAELLGVHNEQQREKKTSGADDARRLSALISDDRSATAVAVEKK